MQPTRVLERWIESASTSAPSPTLPAAPVVRSRALAEPLALLDWDELGVVLLASAPADVTVVRDGKRRSVPPPRSTLEMTTYLAAGFGVSVTNVERHAPRLADLARELASDLGGRARVALSVTAHGARSAAWHPADDDLFLLQLIGAQDYALRPAADRPSSITSLTAGDALFVPARWESRAALAHTQSLAIAIAVIPRAAQLSGVG